MRSRSAVRPIARLASGPILILALSLHALAGAQEFKRPILADPPPDSKNPARMEAVWIPSGGVRMNGVLYVAAGAQPHPTAVIFHGLPGNEQNLDLAQTMRSVGFNVLTFHYRGSWGSPGKFTLRHGVEDGQAALEFLKDADTVGKFHIDPKRLLVVGHSYGGFVATRVAAAHPEIFALVLIAPWNLGDDISFLKVPEAQLPDVAHKMFDDIDGRLGGTSDVELAREMLSPGRDWRLETSARAIRNLPLFVAVADRDAEDCRAASLLATLERLGAPHVSSVTMNTDHSFSDHRAALQNAILDWLLQKGI